MNGHRKRRGDEAEAEDMRFWSKYGTCFPLSPSYPGVDILGISYLGTVLLIEVKGKRMYGAERAEAVVKLRAALKPLQHWEVVSVEAWYDERWKDGTWHREKVG